jgi:hypothetical protein
MTDHRYMYPRVTELRELRPTKPTLPPVRQPTRRPSQRRLVEMSLLRVPEAR